MFVRFTATLSITALFVFAEAFAAPIIEVDRRGVDSDYAKQLEELLAIEGGADLDTMVADYFTGFPQPTKLEVRFSVSGERLGWISDDWQSGRQGRVWRLYLNPNTHFLNAIDPRVTLRHEYCHLLHRFAEQSMGDRDDTLLPVWAGEAICMVAAGEGVVQIIEWLNLTFELASVISTTRTTPVAPIDHFSELEDVQSVDQITIGVDGAVVSQTVPYGFLALVWSQMADHVEISPERWTREFNAALLWAWKNGKGADELLEYPDFSLMVHSWMGLPAITESSFRAAKEWLRKLHVHKNKTLARTRLLKLAFEGEWGIDMDLADVNTIYDDWQASRGPHSLQEVLTAPDKFDKDYSLYWQALGYWLASHYKKLEVEAKAVPMLANYSAERGGYAYAAKIELLDLLASLDEAEPGLDENPGREDRTPEYLSDTSLLDQIPLTSSAYSDFLLGGVEITEDSNLAAVNLVRFVERIEER